MNDSDGIDDNQSFRARVEDGGEGFVSIDLIDTRPERMPLWVSGGRMARIGHRDHWSGWLGYQRQRTIP
ncbi:MAG: hypothetical protein ACLP3K_01345 [Candidatus Acidiferrales bacterium]